MSEEFQQCFLTTEDSENPEDLQPIPSTNNVDREITDMPSIAPSICSTTSDLTLQTMQQQLAMMQVLMTQMNNNNDGANRKHKKKRNPNQLKYCHIHGACNHESPECRSKAEGHKDKAMFANRMGGSTKNIKA